MVKRSDSNEHQAVENPAFQYTCKEYREEMMLLNLQRRLHGSDLTEDEEKRLKETIDRLKREMDMA